MGCRVKDRKVTCCRGELNVFCELLWCDLHLLPLYSQFVQLNIR